MERADRLPNQTNPKIVAQEGKIAEKSRDDYRVIYKKSFAQKKRPPKNSLREGKLRSESQS